MQKEEVPITPTTQIALSFVGMGILTIALNIPLLQGKIKRNSFYGIRTPKAFKSDELWFKINRYGAQQMMIWAALMVVLGVATFFIRFGTATHLGIWFGLIVVLSLIIPSVQIFRYSKRL